MCIKSIKLVRCGFFPSFEALSLHDFNWLAYRITCNAAVVFPLITCIYNQVRFVSVGVACSIQLVNTREQKLNEQSRFGWNTFGIMNNHLFCVMQISHSHGDWPRGALTGTPRECQGGTIHPAFLHCRALVSHARSQSHQVIFLIWPVADRSTCWWRCH